MVSLFYNHYLLYSFTSAFLKAENLFVTISRYRHSFKVNFKIHYYFIKYLYGLAGIGAANLSDFLNVWAVNR